MKSTHVLGNIEQKAKLAMKKKTGRDLKSHDSFTIPYVPIWLTSTCILVAQTTIEFLSEKFVSCPAGG